MHHKSLRYDLVLSSLLMSTTRRPTGAQTSAFRSSLARLLATNDGSNRLFEYTSGRWLYNEQKRLQERERCFNVSALKRLAAEAVSKDVNDIVYFDKLGEGASNRAFIIRMRDGHSIVARIPYAVTQPRGLLVASEAATMTYLRSKGFPVPEIYGYSTSTDNAAGVEYIFMSHSHGRQLSSIWLGLTSPERCKFVHRLVSLEKRLFETSFPASGSLFFRRDLPAGSSSVPLDADRCTSQDSIHVGPSLALPLWFGRRAKLDVNRGAFTSAQGVLECGARKELEYLEKHGRPLLPFDRIRRETFDLQPQSPKVHADSLEKYLQIARHLIPPHTDLSLPILRHPDLRPSNIFVSEDLNITSLIDWQSSVVLPNLLSAGIPDDLNNSHDPVSQRLETPRLPPNLHEMNEDEQSEQLAIHRERELHYEYIKRTAEANPLHFAALTYPYSTGRRKIYQLASDPWQGDNVPLRSSLIFVKQHWNDFCSDSPTTPCPISFTPAEEEECLRLDDSEREAEEQMRETKDMLKVGPEGWVLKEHFEAAREAVVEMKRLAREQAETQMDRTAIEDHWVFDDFDEDVYL